MDDPKIRGPQQRGRDIESSEQAEPFVPPETPDPVPEPEDHPARPEAIDKDFTRATEDPPKK